MKLNPFAFVIIKMFYSLIHFMVICSIIKMHCKLLLQMQDLHGVFTARTRRAHGALKDPTARCPTRCANAKPRRLFWACSKQTPPHVILGDCTSRTSAFCNFLERCGNAVRTPHWCDRGLRTVWHLAGKVARFTITIISLFKLFVLCYIISTYFNASF